MNFSSILVEDPRADMLRVAYALDMLPIDYLHQVPITKENIDHAMAQLKSLVVQQIISERDLRLTLEVLYQHSVLNRPASDQPVMHLPEHATSHSNGQQREAPSGVPMATGWVASDMDTAERTSNVSMENSN